jgi:UDP-N-acetylmuramoyl-tripeptide--D-alanyl-D-alanine ligase
MLTAAVERIVSATGGALLTGSPDVIGNDIAVDSREVGPGCVFVALPGERVDGHEFLDAAIEGGARVLVVSRDEESLAAVIERAARREVAVIRVSDCVKAVQDLAIYHRARLHCEVVGVTGSTGKTTTKDFLNAVLRSTLRVVSTQGNQNNELGVPLTVLRAGADTDVLVVEMGMRGLGQIAELCVVARPTVALVTNVGVTHIELLGSQDAVASAKGELVRALEPDGAAFLNGDDSFSAMLAETSRAPVTYYGLSEDCAVRAENIEVDAESRASFDLVADEGTVRLSLTVPGRHNVYNALAAAAVGLHLGVPMDRLQAALASAELSAMRMQVFTSADGVTVINDAYNANPVSMQAAVFTLAEMGSASRRIAVLGDMAELGSLTELAHFRVGEAVARLPIDMLLTVGPRAGHIADGARAAGMPRDRIHACVTAEEAADVLRGTLSHNDAVLVKASRVMGLESIVEEIVSPA